MLKKFVFYFLLFLVIIPFGVSASENSLVKVGNSYYDTLEEAIANAGSMDTIMLISDAILDDSLLINKTINLNLNGNDIEASEKVFLVQGGTLNVDGEGTIRETNPNYGAIMVIGSSSVGDKEYSVVNIGKDVTLEGWSGVFVSHDNSKSYGVEVNLAGDINAVSDVNGGSGIGVYVNGNIKEKNNVPVINILDGVEIISNGNGLYIAGYSIFNIGKAYISGSQSGIGIKAGILNIDGAFVVCNGEDNTPTEGYNNGMNASGVALQIESNNGYAGDMEVNVDSGEFRSKNSNVIYEYIGRGSNSLVKSMDISSGTFVSDAGKNVFRFSDSFKDKHSSFISGGRYSSDPSLYLDIGYKIVKDGGMFSVIKSTLKDVGGNSVDSEYSDDGFNIWLVIFGGIIVLLVSMIFFNKKKIFNLFSNSLKEI